jgi:hypothetical protein
MVGVVAGVVVGRRWQVVAHRFKFDSFSCLGLLPLCAVCAGPCPVTLYCLTHQQAKCCLDGGHCCGRRGAPMPCRQVLEQHARMHQLCSWSVECSWPDRALSANVHCGVRVCCGVIQPHCIRLPRWAVQRCGGRRVHALRRRKMERHCRKDLALRGELHRGVRVPTGVGARLSCRVSTWAVQLGREWSLHRL